MGVSFIFSSFRGILGHVHVMRICMQCIHIACALLVSYLLTLVGGEGQAGVLGDDGGVEGGLSGGLLEEVLGHVEAGGGAGGLLHRSEGSGSGDEDGGNGETHG